MAEPNPLDGTFRELQPAHVSRYLEGAEAPLELPKIEQIPPTDFGAFVVGSIARVARQRPKSPTLDQSVIRGCFTHASSFLITDHLMNPAEGLNTWSGGLTRLTDLVVALHNLGELELDTFITAQRACKECWITSASFKGIEDCRVVVRASGNRLRELLDSNGKTYKGNSVS